MANKRITDVDYIDSLDNNVSFFINHSNTLKQIHNRDAVFGVTSGGTGANNVTDARSNLGLGSVATENILPVSKGGTGSDNMATARNNLGLGAVATEDVVPIECGGTGADNGEAALENLFANAERTILTYDNQYGDSFPPNPVNGQIFFLRLS